MRILCFAYLFNGVTVINLNLLYVKGRSDLVLRLEIIKKCIAFSIVFITAFFNVTVMCIGQVVNSLIALSLNTIYTKKLLGYSLLDQMKTIFPYLMVALVILAEALAICHFIPNNWISLSFSTLLCAGTYILLHMAIKSYALAEAKDYTISLLKRFRIIK